MGLRDRLGLKTTSAIDVARGLAADERALHVLAGPVTSERVSGSVEYVEVPESHAFYATAASDPVTEHVLAVPESVFALISPEGWSSAPAPESGFVLLWREGSPPEDDIIVPLMPSQSSGPFKRPDDFKGREIRP